MKAHEIILEGVEDRTSYQVAKILADKGIKYDPSLESKLISAIGLVMVKELGMNPKTVRNIISYDEDFLSDTLSELHGMSNGQINEFATVEEDLSEGPVTKKPQPYNEPNWAKNLPKEKLDALAGPRYKKDKKQKN